MRIRVPLIYVHRSPKQNCPQNFFSLFSLFTHPINVSSLALARHYSAHWGDGTEKDKVPALKKPTVLEGTIHMKINKTAM